MYFFLYNTFLVLGIALIKLISLQAKTTFFVSSDIVCRSLLVLWMQLFGAPRCHSRRLGRKPYLPITAPLLLIPPSPPPEHAVQCMRGRRWQCSLPLQSFSLSLTSYLSAVPPSGRQNCPSELILVFLWLDRASVVHFGGV